MNALSRVFTFALIAGTLAYGQSSPSTLTNDDLIKLSKSGLSDAFVIDMVNKQGGRLTTDVSGLVELKRAGVQENIIAAAMAKSPAREPLNTDSIVRLVRAGFSDTFIVDLMQKRPGQYATDTSRVLELKDAGVSERVLAMMVTQGGGREIPSGTQISVRLIDGIDSSIHRAGDTFHASLQDPITLGDEVIAKKGSNAVVRLSDLQESGKLQGRTSLTVQLVSVEIDGKIVPVQTSKAEQYSGSRGERTAKTAAGVGIVGAIIGGIAGGGKGAAIGAAAGAGAGAGSQVLLDPQKVKAPPESLFTFTIERTVRVP